MVQLYKQSNVNDLQDSFMPHLIKFKLKCLYTIGKTINHKPAPSA